MYTVLVAVERPHGPPHLMADGGGWCPWGNAYEPAKPRFAATIVAGLEILSPRPPTEPERSDMADEPEILNPQEAAEFLRVPLLTVQRQAKAGRLPGRRIGKEWRFSRTVLLEWLAAGPDRHDLELYNRRAGGDEPDEGGAEEDEAEAD